MCQNRSGARKVDIMEFAWEFIAVWKNQYFAMIRIQFPEFFRSAIFFLNSFFSSLSIQKANRFMSIPKKYFPDDQKNDDKIECEVLYEPPPDKHHTDIIIIHGLHGSTYKTWRQGFYKCDEIQKIQLRKHIPLMPKADEVSVCTKCNSSVNNQMHKAFVDNSCNNNSEYCSYPTKTSYNSNIDDNIYFNNINLMRNSFMNGSDCGNFTDRDSEFLVLKDDECCDCGNFSTMNSVHCESWLPASNCDVSFLPEKICDSNLDVNKKYKYSFMSDNCKRCKKRRSSMQNMRRKKDCFNSYSFENASEEIFPFDETFYQATPYKYSDSFSSEFEIKKQSLNDVVNAEGVSMAVLNNLIDNQDGNYCNCINKSNTDECYLKYEDIYGNGPKLLKQVMFLFRFMFSFAKEAYSLYKKLWYYSNCNEQLSSCWPRDWLPLDCPYARVISINYTTFLWNPIWNNDCQRMSLQEKSLEMAKQLQDLGVGKKPITWAAHSKGGLFVKQMFINSKHELNGVSPDLFDNTQSMVFYSVPQHGSILAHFFMSPFIKPSIEIKELRAGSRIVRNLQNEFQKVLKESKCTRKNTPITIISYTETIPTNMSGVLLQIVFPTSADPGVGEMYGIPLDHRMICKFSSRESVLYQDLVKLVEKTREVSL